MLLFAAWIPALAIAAQSCRSSPRKHVQGRGKPPSEIGASAERQYVHKLHELDAEAEFGDKYAHARDPLMMPEFTGQMNFDTKYARARAREKAPAPLVFPSSRNFFTP